MYNTGIILSALLLVLFFLGLSKWMIENTKVQRIMVLLTQGFGILGSFCMIMSAVFPINFLAVHSMWSSFLYIMLSTGFVFSAAALRYHPQVSRGLIILGISTAPVVILWSFFRSVYVLEWITLLLFLGYISLVGIETGKLVSRSPAASKDQEQRIHKSGED